MAEFNILPYLITLMLSDVVTSISVRPTEFCKRVDYTEILRSSHKSLSHTFLTRSRDLLSKLPRKLKTNFKEWKFTTEPLLLKLPIDGNEENNIREVKNALFSKVFPTPFKTQIKLAAYSSDVLVELLDMDPQTVNTEHFLLIASGGGVLRGQTPLAHRYGGHQFGVWAGQLGDGRAHILGEYVNEAGHLWELQLKGSGVTQYSRDGDGRAVIRSSVREFLCSEAMHYLGVPTSRAASIIVSDDKIWRDQFYNGDFRQERAAVVLRLAKSWLRFGSFQILTHYGELHILQQLTDFVIKHYFTNIPSDHSDRYLMFFENVVGQTAELIAKWQSVGFTHGVCNTDNFSILSITIDYGPFSFMDHYDPKMVPNTSDDEKRYSYENQPSVGFYNLDKLRQALLPLLPVQNQFTLTQILNGYQETYKKHFRKFFCLKLGLVDAKENDEYLVSLLLKIMSDAKSDFAMTFRHLSEWNLKNGELEHISSKLWTLEILKSRESFKHWTRLYLERISSSNVSENARKQLMHQSNPRYVLRNWIAEDIIRNVENDDFKLLHKAIEIFKNPYKEQEAAERLGYSDPPPPWASEIKVSCSS